MSQPAIKAVLFDVGGVLHTLAKEYVETAGLEHAISDPKLRETVWREQVVGKMGKGTLDEVSFRVKLNREHGIELTDPIDLFRQNFEHALVPNLLMFACAERIRRLGIVTSIFSNTIPPHEEVLRSRGMYKDFNPIFLSYRTGYQKPDPKAYGYVINALGVKPSDIVLIDDLEENVVAANAIGMNGIQYIYTHDQNTQLLLQELKKYIPEL